MVYCGLVSPHRSVGGDQVTVTAPRVGSDANETMCGAPTAAGEEGNNSEHTKINYICVFTIQNDICSAWYYSHTFAGSH